MEVPVEFLIRTGRRENVEVLRDHGQRRLAFALRRFAPRIDAVRLRLVDVNGPRRGVDSRCSLTATIAGGGRVFVEATAARPFDAITHAARRLSGSLRRELRRHNDERRGRAALT